MEEVRFRICTTKELDGQDVFYIFLNIRHFMGEQYLSIQGTTSSFWD